MTYSLQNFLGETNYSCKSVTNESGEVYDDYIYNKLLKNCDNLLYQMTIYLAPGDYHRFHSPADWKINLRRHFQGLFLAFI